MQPLHFIRNCSSISAFVLVVWDGVINYDDEYRYIWRCRATGVKCMYLFSRYFGICCQTANLAALLGPLASIHIPPQVCALWFGSQMASAVCLMVTLEMVLSLRLYALYHKNRNIGVLLIIAIAAGVCVTSVFGIRTLRALQFDTRCFALKSPYDVLYFSTFDFMRHAFLWLLAIHKRNIGRLGNSKRAPIVSLMLRDGALIFAAIGVTIATLTPYSLAIHAAAHILFTLPMSLVSILTCRLILNMQMLQTCKAINPPELTTNIALDDSQATECNSPYTESTFSVYTDSSHSKTVELETSQLDQ